MSPSITGEQVCVSSPHQLSQTRPTRLHPSAGRRPPERLRGLLLGVHCLPLNSHLLAPLAWESGEKWEGPLSVVLPGLSRNSLSSVERGRWAVAAPPRSNHLEEEPVWLGRPRRARGEKLGRSLGRTAVSAGVGGPSWRACRPARGPRLVCGPCTVPLSLGGEPLGQLDGGSHTHARGVAQIICGWKFLGKQNHA